MAQVTQEYGSAILKSSARNQYLAGRIERLTEAAYDLRVAVDQPVHAKLLQDQPVNVLGNVHFLPVHHRVLDIVVENPGRNHLL